MKLYYSPGACSLAPHIVGNEAELSLDLHRVDVGTHRTHDGVDFYSINPKGYVPLLQLDDDGALSEGTVICQYLADRAANVSLMPAAGTIARYRVMEWQNFITSELHKSFSPLFHPELDAVAKSIFATGLRKKFAWVSEQLTGKDYLTGTDFTVADAYLFVVAGWSRMVKLDLSDLQPLQDFIARVSARPAVKRALQTEGLA